MPFEDEPTKLLNDFRRLDDKTARIRVRHKKEQNDLTEKLREVCETAMLLNGLGEHEIERFRRVNTMMGIKEQYDVAFVKFDKDHTSYISWEEYLSACKYLDVRKSQSQLRKSFNSFDLNGDGRLDEKDFFSTFSEEDTNQLLPLPQIATLRKHLTGIRTQMDLQKRDYKDLKDNRDQILAELNDTKRKLIEERNRPIPPPTVDNNWHEQDALIQEQLKEIENFEKENASFKEKLSLANKEISRLTNFGAISRKTVNNLETTMSNNILDCIKMLMTATEADKGSLENHAKQKKQLQVVSEMREVFLEIDTNHSSEVDFAEFSKASKKLKIYSERELQRKFSKYDHSRNNSISENEFMQALLGETFEEVGVMRYTHELTDWIRKIATEFADLRSHFTIITQERNHLSITKKELEESADAYRQETSELLNQLGTLEGELRKLRRELNKAKESERSRINDLEHQLKNEKQTVLELTEKIREIYNENEKQSAKFASIIDELTSQHESKLKAKDKKIEKMKISVQILKEEYQKLKMEIQRLREYCKGTRNENIYKDNRLSQLLRDSMRQVLLTEGASKSELKDYDVETSSVKLMSDLIQAFLELDAEHTQRMSFEKFVDAWSWLDLKNDSQQLQNIFNSIDRNGNGVINESEFLISVIGEGNEALTLSSQVDKACVVIQKLLEQIREHEDENLILHQQIDDQTRRIAELTDDLANSKVIENELENKILQLQKRLEELMKNAGDLDGALQGKDSDYMDLQKRYSELERELQNALAAHQNFKNKTLKNRLNEVTRQLANDISDNVKQLNTLMEREITTNKETNVSDEQIISQLSKAFGQFDKNQDGQLDFDEFVETWKYIGLSADESELRDIFAEFDQNQDGYISDSEFIDAIMEERLMEMNMFLLFMKLARAREDLGQFMKLQKKQLASTRNELHDLNNKFRIETKSNARRRTNSVGWEETLHDNMKQIVELIIHLSDGKSNGAKILTLQDEDRRRQYDELKEVFVKHDIEQNGCLTFEQFDKAWVDLNLPGNAVNRKRIFTFIDEEASGYLSFREFVNACVGGEQGSQLGPLTEMDIAYKYLKLMNDAHMLSQDELENYMKRVRELESLKEEFNAYKLKVEREFSLLQSENENFAEVINQLRLRIREKTQEYINHVNREKEVFVKFRNEQEKRLREQIFLNERLEDDNELQKRQLEHFDENLTKLLEPLTEENSKLSQQFSALEQKNNSLLLEIASLQVVLQSYEHLSTGNVRHQKIPHSGTTRR